MNFAMDALLRRMAERLKNAPNKALLKTQAEHRACSLVWRDRTRSSRCEGSWRGPGWYTLSGYRSDEGRDVATVTYAAPPPQMELPP